MWRPSHQQAAHNRDVHTSERQSRGGGRGKPVCLCHQAGGAALLREGELWGAEDGKWHHRLHSNNAAA